MPLPRTPVAATFPGYAGLNLNVWDYGGDGPPLLFAHCTGTLARIWDVVVAELNDAFRVLAVDTRGHGDSATPPTREDYAWSCSGQDLMAVLTHFNLGKGIGAVGHSAGGAHVAYAEHSSPGTFGKILLIDPIIGPREYFSGKNPLAEKVRYRINDFDGLAQARERLVSKPPMTHWVAGAVDAYMAHAFNVTDDGRCSLKCPGDREAWYYELGGASDVYETLETFQCKTCLVTGSESYVQPLVAAQQARIPNAQREVVPGVGHFVPQDKPVETAALIAAWFGSER